MNKNNSNIQNNLYKISKIVHDAHDLNILFKNLHKIITELFEVKNFYIALLNKDLDLLTYPYYHDIKDQAPKEKFLEGKGLTHYTIKKGKGMIFNKDDYQKLADKNIYTIMPGFTHLKNAQAISFAHYIMAYVEMFKRDKKRFINNLDSLNENPLGVAALTGTSFNIDRNYTTKKLGFTKPTNNSIDTISDRDFVLDFLYSISVCAMHISRIAEELIIWNSDAFKLINLSDKVVTGSSIMPQKKNPDLLEFLRGKSGIIYGNLFSMLTVLKSLPLSYYKDLQDDKEIVFKSNDTLQNCLKILDEILKNFTPNKKQMIELANTGYLTATDLADYLVKNHSMPFRKAYKVTANIVNFAEKKKKNLDQLTLAELKKIEPKLSNDVLKVFDLKNSVNSKKSYGGTSFDNIKKMILKYKRKK